MDDEPDPYEYRKRRQPKGSPSLDPQTGFCPICHKPLVAVHGRGGPTWQCECKRSNECPATT